ncbi:uncharacterized protein BO87DRAFT_212307 [Aspergillus neoniger CBS 115656]|uniref:Uncharacterized protein n=1 Tax=Aspergillus neoniger (strain CBS 115656) TaxID=1448310 RepID=A0A318YTI1_ASPNB|nr:hypothetical protein BO87DRAFT_243242 [Aspergillus neoniger CBS 115656]XP_025474110.1 hypothetical protein BO87DRAFT_212307 [Aspergillus neoniger CBS 115656]PYH28136.1 hypothetical protein BO87DRAFT_243242 [Aspergillus neoniger CBS 115656]PYH28632.1 hypothetical protein BO87DRAFT_212307 [Aspergillus neoniger CBS 115656]
MKSRIIDIILIIRLFDSLFTVPYPTCLPRFLCLMIKLMIHDSDLESFTENDK